MVVFVERLDFDLPIHVRWVCEMDASKIGVTRNLTAATWFDKVVDAWAAKWVDAKVVQKANILQL